MVHLAEIQKNCSMAPLCAHILYILQTVSHANSHKLIDTSGQSKDLSTEEGGITFLTDFYLSNIYLSLRKLLVVGKL